MPHFDSLVWVLSNGVEVHHCSKFFLRSIKSFELISCIIVLKGFASMFNKEIGKRHFRTFPGKVEKRKKCFINNKNLVDYHWRNWVDWMNTKWEKKTATSKNLYFEKKGLNFLTYSTSLEAQKLVVFGLQLCYINHKNCRGSWNLVFMILGDTSTHNSYFMGIRLSPHFVIILHWDIKCLLNHFSCTKFNHLR